MKFFAKGHLTSGAANVLSGVGSLIIFATTYFFEEWSGFWFWTLLLIGGVVGYLGGYGGLASRIGMQPPFTNDPFGWRHAKETYGAKDVADVSPPTR